MVFHKIVREWCRTYRPMLDSMENGNRRFYLTDSTGGVVEMAKGIANQMSPMVIMESTIEGYMRGGKIYRNYPIYFFVRAENMSSGDDAAAAKEEAWWHCQNFLTWLRYRHDNDTTAEQDYARIDMEDSIDIQTAGPLENGWFAVMIQLERLELANLCVDENLYVTEEENEEKGGEG